MGRRSCSDFAHYGLQMYASCSASSPILVDIDLVDLAGGGCPFPLIVGLLEHYSRSATPCWSDCPDPCYCRRQCFALLVARVISTIRLNIRKDPPGHALATASISISSRGLAQR